MPGGAPISATMSGNAHPPTTGPQQAQTTIMAHLKETELTALYALLQRQYLAATPGQRARIDVTLTAVEQQLAAHRRRRFLQRLRGLLAPPTLPPPAVARETVHIARVVDGDTVLLADGRRLRYIGLNAPEIFMGYRRLDEPEPYAIAAAAANRQLVEARTVQTLADAEPVDRYGRLLRYVFCDGVFVNARLVLDGLAISYPIPPNDRFADLLARCELDAQRRRAGLWRNRQK